MRDLKGLVAWVTGAGTGIGEAAAIALAHEGATVILTGRRREPLEAVAAQITADGGKAEVEAGDLSKASVPARIVAAIEGRHGRLDILVNNAGVNIPARNWARLTAEGIETLVAGNLTSALLVTQSVLPIMRRQGDGLLIHTSSWAGRFVGLVAGPVYTAAKHGVVAMSHSLNMEECVNGIRSTVICPGEVSTPIMDQRSPPETPEARARMVQPEDMGNLVAFVARQPRHVCLNEILISPSWNRGYVGAFQARQKALARASQNTGAEK
ncbi:MAG: SDR family oxidoreductase [Hyphomicrobiaceae bacterium]